MVFQEQACDQAVVPYDATVDGEAEGGDGYGGDNDTDDVGNGEFTPIQAEQVAAESTGIDAGSGKGDSDEDGDAQFAVFLDVGVELMARPFQDGPDGAVEPRPPADQVKGGGHDEEDQPAEDDIGDGADERDHGPAYRVAHLKNTSGDGGTQLEGGNEGDEGEDNDGLNHNGLRGVVGAVGLEPTSLAAQDPKSCVSANFTTRPQL
jgi:hypothetical protein